MTALHRWPDGRIPVLLSSHCEELVAADATAVRRYLDRRPTVEQVASTLWRMRRLRRHRAVIRAGDLTELASGLDAVAAGEEHPLVGYAPAASRSALAFIVPGQGNHWPGMGAESYQRLPVYRSAADECESAFVAGGFASPLRYLTSSADDCSQTEIQGAQFTHAVALARVWESCGIRPDFTVGHSLGEVAAAHLAGSVTLPEAAAVVAARAEVVDGLPGRYGMAVLGVDAAQVRDLITAVPGWLELSVVNAATSVVVSGERDAITAIAELVSQGGQFARIIPVNYPAHTSALESLRDELTRRLPSAQFTDGVVPFVGSATGDTPAAGVTFTDYWYANLRNTVRFDRAVDRVIGHGANAFVELSAHPALLTSLDDLLGDSRHLPDGPALLVGSGHREAPLIDQLSANIAAAAITDPDYRWPDLFGAVDSPLPDFPNSPMRSEYYWATPEPLPALPGPTVLQEDWKQLELAPSAPGRQPRKVAVLDLGGESPMGAALRATIDHHDHTVDAAPAQAEVLVALAPALDHPDAVRAAADLAELIDGGLLGYADAIGASCRDVWLVTVGGEQVRPGEPVALPAQAALAGMHRSLRFECEDVEFHHLDVPSWELSGDIATAVVDALVGAEGELALRDTLTGPGLFSRQMLDSTAVPAPWPLADGLLDSVVITGGSGMIGQQFARHFAEHGARRIILLSRGGLKQADLDSLRASTSTQVLAPRCDITDPDQVAAVAGEFGGDGASLVIHTAGTAAFATRDRLTRQDFLAMSAAKVTGLTRVTDLWPMRADARILLCSSVTGVWGAKGAMAYAAANRLLDVLAGQLRAKGLRCASVRWGLWQGSGILTADEIAQGERGGLRPMSPRRAVEAGLFDYPGDPLIVEADAERLRIYLGAPAAPSSDTDTGTGGDVDAAGAVRTELAAVLSLADAATLDINATLFDLGIDSLLGLELRKRIKRATGRNVPLAKILGGITGTELIGVLEDAATPPVPTTSRAKRAGISGD